MLKFANQVIDAYDDPGHEQLKKIAAARPETYLRTPSEHQGLSPRDFALSVITKKASQLNYFPVVTKDDAWLSDQFFAMNHQKLPGQSANIAAHFIKKACEKHGIEPSPPTVKLAAAQVDGNVFVEPSEGLKLTLIREQHDMSKFAAAQDIGDNYSIAQGVMRTPGHVKVAAIYFAQKQDKMPLELRHKYAAAIQRRAHELGMQPEGGIVGKYASNHYSGMVDAHVRGRIALLDGINKEAQVAYQGLSAARDRISPSEFAQAMHGLDKQAKLDRYYGGQLQNPFLATFAAEPDRNATWRFKTASVNLDSDGLKALATQKHAAIASHFGKHVADELRKDPTSVFESLPMDAKVILGDIAAGHLC